MAMTALTIINAVHPDGSTTDVHIVDGVVVAERHPDAEVLDAGRRLVLPAMAEAHAHLDKAFLAETVPNPTGDLMGAIEAMEQHRESITISDTMARAERAARLLASNGVTAIRTHADLTVWNGLDSVEALLAVRDRLRHLVDIEVIALLGSPSTGTDGAAHRSLLADAISLGIDGVGGCPHLEPDPNASIDFLLTSAEHADLPVDLHTDEHLDASRITLGHLADTVLRSGFRQSVTASHCVSLGLQSPTVQREVAEKVAAAHITVVALPSTNLFLQGRHLQQSMPRALTAVQALRTAGANVCAGYDNLQDPFNPVGRADCLETASLMISAAHLLPDDAYQSVSNGVRTMMRRPPAGTDVGMAADFVLLPATSVREAIAFAPAGRIVVSGGTVIGG
jgi:cytosine deaminase